MQQLAEISLLPFGLLQVAVNLVTAAAESHHELPN
jgi:hypothetical protein